MNRLSLAELKAKSGIAFISNVEAIKGGDERIPMPKPKPMPCDNV